MRTAPPTRPVNRRAFSLVEVMVSVLILTVAIVGLTGGITTALRSSRDGEQTTQGVMIAVGRIEQVRADGDLVDGQTEGTAGDYRWKQMISPASVAGLHEVAVEVTRAPSDAPVYVLRTMLFEPPPENGEKPKKPDDRRSRRKSGRTS
jgi:prepilin-type N-terminal cleavage/methylation domain-containing protein